MSKDQKTGSVDAVSARLLYHKKSGKLLYSRGDATIRMSGRDMDFLKYEEAANLFYKSSIAYKACGRWQEAGDSLKRVAWCYERLKAYLTAAAIYCEAAETAIKTDKTEAIELYKAASALYVNANYPDIAGCLERKMAMLHFWDGAWEDAAACFSTAAQLLVGEVNRVQSDFCLEKKAECYVLLGKNHEEASSIYESIAESCVRSNLRRFNARDYLLKAILCLIGTPISSIRDNDDDSSAASQHESQVLSEEKYNAIEWKVHEYEAQISYGDAQKKHFF